MPSDRPPASERSEHHAQRLRRGFRLGAHEIDPLAGVLSVDRAPGLDPVCYRAEWERHHRAEGRSGEPQLRSADASLHVRV
jgi:hypothetical protein